MQSSRRRSDSYAEAAMRCSSGQSKLHTDVSGTHRLAGTGGSAAFASIILLQSFSSDR